MEETIVGKVILLQSVGLDFDPMIVMEFSQSVHINEGDKITFRYSPYGKPEVTLIRKETHGEEKA